MLQISRVIAGHKRLPSPDGIVSLLLIFALVFSSLPLRAADNSDGQAGTGTTETARTSPNRAAKPA